MSFRYPTTGQIVALNAEVGGPGAGVRDMRGVESAVERPQQTFDGNDLYPSIWDKAAAILHSLCSGQHFLDGNKRTAWVASRTFLKVNGYLLDPALDVDDAERFVLDLSTRVIDDKDAALWLRQHVEPLVLELSAEGHCALCGDEGDLVGVEFFDRDLLISVGRPIMGSILKSVSGPDGPDVSVVQFDIERDLVPHVCRRCRDGWIRAVDRQAMPILSALINNEPGPLPSFAARRFAAWAVKQAILRSLIEDVSIRDKFPHLLASLRQRQLAPPGWAVWVARFDQVAFHAGRLHWAGAAGDPEKHGTAEARLHVMHHTAIYERVVVSTIYMDPTTHDWPNSGATPTEGPVTVQELWPATLPVVWPPDLDLNLPEIQALGDGVANETRRTVSSQEWPNF